MSRPGLWWVATYVVAGPAGVAAEAAVGWSVPVPSSEAEVDACSRALTERLRAQGRLSGEQQARVQSWSMMAASR